jgi:geranylgeranyl diphosphate synthase, type II
MANMTDKRIEQYYQSETKKIEQKLNNSFRRNLPKSLYDPCQYALETGGKRLRPFLVIMSAQAVGGKPKSVYNAAMAVEILHNFTLIHDDIMDNADIRRGRISLHKKYDENTAILAGDNLMAIAYQYLTKDCKNNVNEIINHFTQGIIEICEGQSYDKDFELKKNVTIDEYLLMISKKTAALVEMCCFIGAKIVDGTDSEVKNMANYGRNLGLAFQLQDDLLDIFGDEKKFGKTVGGDLVEGKKTFLFLKALEKSKGEDRKLLNKVIVNKGIRKNQISKYRVLYEKLGVIDETKKEIRKYSKNALKCVSKVKQPEAREILYWLTHKLVDRIN